MCETEKSRNLADTSLRFAPMIVMLAIYGTYAATQRFGQTSRFAVEDAGYTHFVELVDVVAGAVILTLLATWLHVLVASCRRSGAAIVVLALFAYAALCLYNWKTNSTLSFSLLADHFRELQEREAWIVASDQLSVGNYYAIASIYVSLWAVEWKFSLFSRLQAVNKRSLFVACLSCLAWLGAVLWGPVTLEPVTLLARSAFGESFRLRQHGLAIAVNHLAEFPYVQNGGTNAITPIPPRARPHVLVLMIESFNVRFVTARAADASPLMPHFEAAIRKGVWVEPFYCNATYTIKGQEAVLTSLPPTLSGNLANTHEHVRIRALPTILREQGYETIFFKRTRISSSPVPVSSCAVADLNSSRQWTENLPRRCPPSCSWVGDLWTRPSTTASSHG
ncbi:MAG: sulfatase-like hydrolase/transferase [Verrucomicrobia bacterium]|nr:sulfatase-like hydrolase/transferase [Verrucomicrobiota bacterium]